MNKSKRAFLKTSILIAPALGLGYYFNRVSYESLIKKAVYKRLHYLNLDKNGVDAFAIDYSKEYHKSKITLISIDAAVLAQETFPWFSKLNERINSYEDYIIIKFLESSDFFINNGDENKLVKYNDLNQSNPYYLVCSNHFAKFDYN